MYRYLHLDVFTDRRFEGNQLAVFPEPQGLTTDQMQRIAKEMALEAGIGVSAQDLVHGLPVQSVSCGVPFLFVPLTTRAAVDAGAIDRKALRGAPTRQARRAAGLQRRGPDYASTRRRGLDAGGPREIYVEASSRTSA